MAFSVGAAFDGVALQGVTNAVDRPEMLKLMTGQIVSPRFDAVASERQVRGGPPSPCRAERAGLSSSLSR